MILLLGPAGARLCAIAARGALGMALVVAAAATAWAQAILPQVTAAVPFASRVAQWDEFTGRFEAMQRVEVRPRVSGYIDKVNFRDGTTVKEGRPAVHYRSAALPACR